MERIQKFLLIFLSLLLSSCITHKPLEPGTVPHPPAPSSEDQAYGKAVLSSLRQEYSITKKHPRYKDLIAVVKQLTRVVDAGDHPWHVYLLKDDSVKNAAATRGNYIFFWTGMLNFTKNRGEIATVASHEISHIIAGHVRENEKEESTSSWIDFGSNISGHVASNVTADAVGTGTHTGALAGDVAGNVAAKATKELGKGLFLNPYSKSMEMEADLVGMFLMADAGFDPKQAISFWDKASKDGDFSSNISFFSTHPSADDRLERLRKHLSAAEDRYKQAKKGKRKKRRKKK